MGLTREQLDEWLEKNCGNGIPHGEATDTESMLHGLAYILRQIEGTDRYMVNIGQTTSARTALRMALDHFATTELARRSSPDREMVDEAADALVKVAAHYEDCDQCCADAVRALTQPATALLAALEAKP